MAEFANLGENENIPFTGVNTDDNALGLTNPDSVLTGTNRGTQNLGGPNIKSDPANRRIVVNDNTTNRVTLGRTGTGVNDWGLKVSKPTFNVDTATAEQLIFNSSQNVFKIVGTGTGSILITNPYTVSGGITTKTVPHGLTYTPAVLAYISDGLTYTQLPSILSSSSGATSINIQGFGYLGADSTNIYIQVQVAGSVLVGATLPYKYYLLQETAN